MNILLAAVVIVPLAVLWACLAFSRSSREPAFMESLFTLDASLASLATDSESRAFARASLAFFLQNLLAFVLVLSSRDRAALADETAYFASS
jgi:hypothetical protein